MVVQVKAGKYAVSPQGSNGGVGSGGSGPGGSADTRYGRGGGSVTACVVVMSPTSGGMEKW